MPVHIQRLATAGRWHEAAIQAASPWVLRSVSHRFRSGLLFVGSVTAWDGAPFE
jgi:hypothetical protein